MALTLTFPDQHELKPKITVFGVGGAGGNAVNNMIEKQLEGVEFVVANTDAQALAQSAAPSRIQLGVKVTEGLGAGAKASVGAAAAEESIEQIVDHLAGAHMCFITAGMGGGTGTGAAPIIAQAARELGVLTVGVVTKPFQFEGAKRMRQAEEGVDTLQQMVDTLIIIPNQNLFRLATEKTTFTEAFSLADDVLYQGVKGVTDLMVRPGLINLDFADVRAVMDEMGKAMMGTGEAEGDQRAVQAAEKAIANPLLDEISLRGAKGVLINITGSDDLTLFELDEAANVIREQVDPDANIIVGSTLDPNMSGMMRVSVVATGIDAVAASENVSPARPSMVTARGPVPAVEDVAADGSEYDTGASDAPVTTVADLHQNELSLFEQARPQVAEAEDDLPAPAYRAEPEPFEPAPEPQAEETAGFVAPRRPAPGTPTPEALARLRAATEGGTSRREAAAAAGHDAEKPRFGINSLINRMTGHSDLPAQPPQPRQQPMVQRAPTPIDMASKPEDQERDKIEIPAFLRRQAN